MAAVNFTQESKKKARLGASSNISTREEKTEPNVSSQKTSEASLTLHDSFVSLAYAFCASVFISLSHVVVKKMNYLSTGEVSLVRDSGMVVWCVPLIAGHWLDPFGPRDRRFLIVVRSFFNSTANVLNLYAFRVLPMTVATVIIATVPAMVTFLAKLWLAEPCGVVQSVAVLITTVGILLAMKLQNIVQEVNLEENTTTTYCLAAVAAVICIFLLSFCFASVRLLRDVHFSVLVLGIGYFGLLENIVYRTLVGRYALPYCSWGRWGMLAIAALGFLDQMFFTMAIQGEAVGLVIVVKASSDIVLAMIFQVIFFDDLPDAYSVAGGVLVILSISIIGLRKWTFRLDPNSLFRKKMRFLLL